MFLSYILQKIFLVLLEYSNPSNETSLYNLHKVQISIWPWRHCTVCKSDIWHIQISMLVSWCTQFSGCGEIRTLDLYLHISSTRFPYFRDSLVISVYPCFWCIRNIDMKPSLPSEICFLRHWRGMSRFRWSVGFQLPYHSQNHQSQYMNYSHDE